MQGTFFVKIFNKLWFSGVSVWHWNLANAKLSSQKQKSLLNFFKNCGFGQRPYNLPILQFFRRKQPRCLRAKTKFVKTGGSLLEKNLLIYCLMEGFLVAIAFKGLSPLCSSRQTASCLAIVRLHKRKVFVGFAHTHDLWKGRPNFYNWLANQFAKP